MLKMKVIAVVVPVIETVSKNLEKKPEELKIRGGIDTNQTVALLSSVNNTLKCP